MSGYSGVIILAVAALVILPISYITWYNNQMLISDFKESLISMSNRFLKIKAYSLDINASTITWKTKFILCFWVLNSGSSSIPISDLQYIDVILTYNTSSGEILTIWIPYDPKGSPGNEIFWRIEGVRVGNSKNEIVNPIYPSPYIIGVAPESGQWDPGEELLFVVYLTPKYSADTASPVAIYVSLKYGEGDFVSGVSG